VDAADKIAVLDFGAQYTQLIARRIRELSVYSEILPCTVPLEDLLAAGYKGVILSGGPSSVYEEDAPLPPKGLFKAGIPVLGICYGMQAMGYLLGGQVVPSERREYGRAEVRLTGTSPLLRRVEPESNGHVTVWMSHGDSVLKPPPGFIALATTANCPVAAMADEARRLYAVQFHPEVAHTPQGREILENFLEVCEVKRSWSMASFIDTTIGLDPGADRSGPRALRPERGRGLCGRGRARASGHRQPTHVHVRGQCPTTCSARSATASSTRSRASTASSSTSPPNPRARSNGNSDEAVRRPGRRFNGNE